MFTFPEPVRAFADKTTTMLDYPDDLPQQLGKFFYLLGGPVYDGFEKLLLTIAPASIAFARQWCNDLWDPQMRQYPLADPVCLLFWIAFYFGFTFVCRFVGDYVAYPNKLQLRGFSLVYLALQTVLSAYMTVQIFGTAIAANYSLINNPPSKDKRAVKACLLFCLSKIPDFIDTFIHALKGQQFMAPGSQMSFLHVYHHCSIVPYVIFFAYAAPGGDCYQSSGMNSFVHMLMYGRQFLVVYSGRGTPLRAWLDKNKTMMTTIQLVQFAINLLHAVVMLFVVQQPKFPLAQMKFHLIYMVTMIVLFMNFFYQAKKSAAKAKAAAAAAGASKKKE